jgi:butyryl-CoA dehydrogenase
MNQPPVTIIHHPDVRRMLLLQKTFVEGSLSFLLQCFKYTDLEKISDNNERQRYTDLLELLTPVAKTYGAEMDLCLLTMACRYWEVTATRKILY